LLEVQVEGRGLFWKSTRVGDVGDEAQLSVDKRLKMKRERRERDWGKAGGKSHECNKASLLQAYVERT
jgi:hypothetical protein